MFRNYIQVAWRSFRKSLAYHLVGQLGLAVGLGVALLISYYVSNQFSFDRWLNDANTIYRLDTTETYPGRKPLDIARAPGPVATALKDQFHEIDDITRGFVGNVQVNYQQQLFDEKVLVVDDNFLTFFDFRVILGDQSIALKSPNSVAISKKIATKYFGEKSPIGQRLVVERGAATSYIVDAVFNDLPENTHFSFDILLSTNGYFTEKEISSIRDFWGGAYFHTYVKLKPDVLPHTIDRQLPDFTDRNFPDNLARIISTAPHEFYGFSLIALSDIHFYGASLAAMKVGGDIKTSWTLIIVAFLIVTVAAFNFSILSTATATLRAKEVALRKTLGARKGQIIFQFLGEAFLQALTAGLIAAVLSEAVIPIIEANYGSVFGPSPLRGGLYFLWLLALVCTTTLLGGIYSAFLLSGLRPAAIFNPTGPSLLKADNVRLLMVVGQIMITACLVTIATTMVMQQHFLQSRNLGFDPEPLQIVTLPPTSELQQAQRSFVNQVRKVPGVAAVTVSSAVPTEPSEANLSVELEGEAKPLQLGFHYVGDDFFRAYSVQPIAGRLFGLGFSQNAQNEAAGKQVTSSIIINEAARISLRFSSNANSIGRVVRMSDSAEYTIIGVVPNMRYRSLKEPVRPEIFLSSPQPGNRVSIKLAATANLHTANLIDQIWSSIFPAYALRMETMPSMLATLYKADDQNADLLIAFASTALTLSAIGLAATLSFSIMRQRRNLAIRRIYGARTSDLITFVGKKFLKPIIVANVISWPISYYFLQEWLGGFEIRIDLTATPFLASLLLSTVLSIILLLAHVGLLKSTRPVTVLKAE